MAVYGVYRLITSGGVRQFDNEQIFGAAGQQEVMDRVENAHSLAGWVRVYGVHNCKLVSPSNPDEVFHCDLMNVSAE